MWRDRWSSGKTALLAAAVVCCSTSVAAGEAVPEPKDILGFEVGADYHLASYEQAIEYFRSLERASSRIRVFQEGQTSTGKPMLYAVISSEDNMANLETLREISKKLSLVKELTDEQAQELSKQGRPIVYIDGGLHASECAPAQHNIQLAYELVSSEDDDARFIRDNTILVLVFANPDGMDLLADWYRSNLGTPYEVSRMPWLYNKYVGHDNNRDSYMLNMAETQNLTRIVHKTWYPVILYNHHQTAPFPARIWIHPASEPTNPNVHPMLIRWQNLIGSAMGAAFDREGKPGAISRIVFDTWYPGYVTQVVDGHNIASLLTETALYRYATPHFYTLEDFPEEFKDFTVSAFYPSPWKGGWWRLKDAVSYCLTASKAVLRTAAKFREELLYDKYRMGRDVTARFEREPPYGWIIPQDQWDPPTAALMLNKMLLLDIDVYAAEETFVSDGISYPPGTWVIPMTQPFALFVKNLFEEQSYPDLAKVPHAWQGLVQTQKVKGVYLPPYDMAGWTLPYQMGVKVEPAGAPLETKLRKLEAVEAPPGSVEGSSGYGYLISPKNNNSFVAVNRILGKGGEVLRAKESFSVGDTSCLPGTFIVRSTGVSRSFIQSLAQELHLEILGTGTRPSVETSRVRSPRVALYKSWMANVDEGWTRWLLEQYEFPYTSLHDAEVRAGSLGDRFDVLIIPSMSTRSIVEGHRKGTMPPQYVGGMTQNGVRNVKEFVESGGTLVTLNRGCAFAIEKLDIPVKDGLAELRPRGRREGGGGPGGPPKFACPGSLIRMEFNPKHPVSYGMPEEAPAVFSRSPAFTLLPTLDDGKAPATIARYPKGSLLMSGYLLGESYLHHKSSALEVLLGKGKVILLGFGVQSRAQPHGTFKLLFNALYYASTQ